MIEIAQVIPETNIVILSPHFDDVPLTFGGYLLGLKKSGLLAKKKITIVNGFTRTVYQARDTQGNRDSSLKRIQFATGIRLLEDLNCLDEMIGRGQYAYELLGERECTTRQKGWKPGEAFEFPWGNRESFEPEEKEIFGRLKEDARRRLVQEDTAILCLMGMKEHVDHVIQREAVVDAAGELGNRCKAVIYFGEEQPYTGLADQQNWETVNGSLESQKLEVLDYAIDLKTKVALVMKNYPSQVEESYEQGMVNRAMALAKENGVAGAGGVERMYRRKS
jgi:hypothetical protein